MASPKRQPDGLSFAPLITRPEARVTVPIDPKEAAKRLVGFAAVDRFVSDGMCLGLGTGTTAYWAIKRAGEAVAAGMRLEAVVTSDATERLCREFGVPVVPFMSRAIDVAIDGADEVAPDWSLTKGGGGALFREKAIAIAAKRFIVIVDDSKVVPHLGRFATPVEVVPFALPWVSGELAARFPSLRAIERERDGRPYRTDNGNAILDCAFGTIADPAALAATLHAIHGIVDTGLFVGLTDAVLCTAAEGVRELVRYGA
jgi:ribose 5-phosphate isomerase A